MTVFVSSTVRGLEAFRDAAAKGSRSLRHDVIRAEDFSASPDSPQRVCLDGVRKADVTLLILGERYGDLQVSGLSATHEEYREARDRGGVLVFLQSGAIPEPRQEAFVKEVQEWSQGHFTATFATPDELKEAVTSALHEFELSRKTGTVDEGELAARANALVPDTRGFSSPTLSVILVGSPRQSVLRPAELESPDLARVIQKEALFGATPVFDSEGGTKSIIRKGQLILDQDRASILLSALGDVRIVPNVPRDRSDDSYTMALIQEEVQESIERAIRFGGWLLDHVDSKRRLGLVAPVASITNAGHFGWMTRAEKVKSRGSFALGMHGDRAVIVSLTPAVKARGALLPSAREIAEDLTVLLRRELKP